MAYRLTRATPSKILFPRQMLHSYPMNLSRAVTKDMATRFSGGLTAEEYRCKLIREWLEDNHRDHTAEEGPAPVGDIVATVYKDSCGSALYVEPLPPQSLNCLPVGEVGYPVARVWYGLANITPQQQADAEWVYRSPDLDSEPGPRRGTLGDGDGEGS